MGNHQQLFKDHLQARQEGLESALVQSNVDTLVISSGMPFTYFRDDMDAPFHTVPHFAHWCPLPGPHHLLIIQPGKKIRLHRYAPEDFWYEQKDIDDPFWTSFFDISEHPTIDSIFEALPSLGKVAFIGNDIAHPSTLGWAINPENLTKHLDWTRSFKSSYEIECIMEAEKLGAKGHRAAREAFFAGASELEIHHAFVKAVECSDDDLPYTSIVALNEKGSTLHYHAKRKDIRSGFVLLADIGAQFRGYASDITRTYATSKAHERFLFLLKGMEKLQLELCASLKPGMHYAEFHQSAHHKIGELLIDQQILSCSIEQALKDKFTTPFFPHGLGHHLGLQVHDVAGKQLNPAGKMAEQPQDHPYLRTTRTIEENHVFTVEPGLYFIPMLLKKFRNSPQFGSIFNWKLIDELTPHGGIRIEDNIFITKNGYRNLTREHLPN